MRALVLIAAVLASPPSLPHPPDAGCVTQDGQTRCASTMVLRHGWIDFAEADAPQTLCEWNSCGVLIFEMPGLDCARLECLP